ncbi:MAG: hypothetical protein NT158_11345 [Cyanobacteria bacterium]|nr:hypothetical protein [Cyanobacteriota bacterium]
MCSSGIQHRRQVQQQQGQKAIAEVRSGEGQQPEPIRQRQGNQRQGHRQSE